MCMCQSVDEIRREILRATSSKLVLLLPTWLGDEPILISDFKVMHPRGYLPTAVATPTGRFDTLSRGWDAVTYEIHLFNCPDDLVRRFMEET